ncbi:type I 3-dehydroquinate dehydratase [Fructobacillus cardui]|uniref:type I 3-dehydroquinate dehydratase n=1 Tax=Fructobacillus cardui TaxID=2893170 RepID=UPI00200A1C0D|nr:type I 3-dehydroquinate dehydratase [Fructobacillus cardui]MCK8627105.1 type I 3-dehydroquinate dehydratase [Fructobacillus cardui]
MKITELFEQKKPIAQSALAVPMALGPADKFTPFQQALDQKNPDAVIWQADAIVDEFSKEVIWDQVKAGGAQAIEERDASAMKKAAMKAELDRAHQEFLSNWPAMHQQIVKELVDNALQTAGDHLVLLAYTTKEAGGQGELAPADQAYFLATALQVGADRFAGVYLPEELDENLQEKVIAVAEKVAVPVIRTGIIDDLTPETIRSAFSALLTKDPDVVNLQVVADRLAEIDLADFELILAGLADQAGETALVLTVTGILSKDQIESWLVFQSALVTLALGENWQTPLIKSTISELGWA